MKSINSRPDLSVIRIYKEQEVVGAGCLVSDEYILTCAHVVAEALGIDAYSNQIPTQEVELDFPTIQPIKLLTATVEFWLPVNPGNSPEDIAVLKLNKSLPKEAKPASLSMTKYELYEHEFEAFGFPKGRNGGAWAKGFINRGVGDGWVQLDGLNIGYRLEEGFSGTPIWDKTIGSVVGMAVAADKLRPEVKAAFMIPTELLLRAWDRLSEIFYIDSRIQSLSILLKPYFQDFKNQIESAYQKSLPPLSVRDFPKSIPEIVRSLKTRENDSEDNYSCLEKFVGYLLLSLKDSDLAVKLCESLTNWLESYLEKYHDLLEFLKAKRQTEKVLNENTDPCLLVAIFEDNNSYSLEGWLIKDIITYQPIEDADCYPLIDENDKIKTDGNLNNLREIIENFVNRCIDRCSQDIKKIQFFLPSKLIVNNLEFLYSLILDPESCLKTTISAEYEISIRLARRLRGAGKRFIVRWCSKGKLLNQQREEPPIDVLKNKNCRNIGKLFNELGSEEIVAVRLNEVIQKSKLEWVIEAFLETGIPLALWMRKETEEVSCSEALEKICKNCHCLDELSEEIKKQSAEAMTQTSHIGNCLSLLWDNPTLVPLKYAPEYVLRMS